MTEHELRALQYIRNTGGAVSVRHFDDDHEPIGPKLREALSPRYMEEDIDGALYLTQAGEKALEDRG